jgi:hypothetical protein
MDNTPPFYCMCDEPFEVMLISVEKNSEFLCRMGFQSPQG